MGSCSDIGDRDLDRLLTGKDPSADQASQQLAALVHQIKAAYADAPGERTEARHLGAIVETARLVAGQAETSPLPVGSANPPAVARNWRKTLFGNRFVVRSTQLAGAGLAAVLATAGLAFAGVTLPSPAQDAFKSVGLELPNQTDGAQPASKPSNVQPDTTKGSDVSDYARHNHPTGPGGGCDFGQAVAALASDGKVAANSPCDKANNNATTHGSRQTGESHSQSGRSTAETAPKGSRQTGENHSQGASPNVQTTPRGSSETGTNSSQQAPTPPATTPPAPPTDTPGGPPTDTPGGPPGGRP
jgi:hypothetical protein